VVQGYNAKNSTAPRGRSLKNRRQRNAPPVTAGYHAAFTAALYASRAGAELDFALDFFA
jgi:hypothetical protein